MTVTTLAPASAPDPHDRRGPVPLTVAYTEYDALWRACLAALAADARHLPNPLGYIQDALGDTRPRPGAHPREYMPSDPADAVFGRW